MRRGKVKRAGGTPVRCAQDKPALRNGGVAIDILLGLREFCFSGASKQESKTPAGGQRYERHGFDFGDRRYRRRWRSQRSARTVSHLRRSGISFSWFPALPGWANFCRAYGAELLVVFR